MIKTLKLGGYLLLVCAVAGLALAGTDQWTKSIIAAQRLETERALLARILPSAVVFEGEGNIRTGRDADGRWAGVILKVVTPGYSGPIEAFVGIDKDRRITGLEILKQTETPGLGTKIALPAFTRQFLGRGPEELSLKISGGAIEGITAATISSRAITNAVRDRIEEYLSSDAATHASDGAPMAEGVAKGCPCEAAGVPHGAGLCMSDTTSGTPCPCAAAGRPCRRQSAPAGGAR